LCIFIYAPQVRSILEPELRRTLKETLRLPPQEESEQFQALLQKRLKVPRS
jgi:hypothetical protein